MTARLLGHWEPGSPEWHAARAAGLGGSEIAAAAGLSPFESRFSLWHRKAGAVGPVEETPEMEWGKRLEPAIIRKFVDEHAGEYAAPGPAGTWCHEDRPWQIANPDQLLVTGATAPEPAAILETKLSVMGDGWGSPGTDEVPIHVRTQVLWYLDVLGLTMGHVAVLVGACDYREYVVEHDPVEAAELRIIGRRFLDDVAAGRRPDIDEHSATYQVIKEMHPEIDGTEVVLPNDLARRFITARHRLAAVKAVEQQARSAVADVMGNAHRATWDGQTIATRQARGDGTPYLVTARDLPHLQETAAA